MRKIADFSAPWNKAAATSRGSGSEIPAFAFEVVTLEESGRQTRRRREHAQQFSEDLGVAQQHGRTRVLRGSSWAAAASFCRAAARSLAGEPSVRSRKIVFRVA
jgi:hypothetical protein